MTSSKFLKMFDEVAERTLPGKQESRMSSVKEYRFKHNPREKVFYDEWVLSHESRRGKSHTTLEYLLAEDPSKPMGECTDRDEHVAALVIQWLGSPVGVSFLKSCGFVPEEDKR